MVEKILAHAGKKGMKWGRRSVSTKDAPGTRRYDTKKLSNKELASVVRRMELERKYVDLNKKGGIVKEGQSATTRFLAKNGDKIAGIVITGAAGAAVKAFLESPKAGKYLERISKIK